MFKEWKTSGCFDQQHPGVVCPYSVFAITNILIYCIPISIYLTCLKRYNEKNLFYVLFVLKKHYICALITE